MQVCKIIIVKWLSVSYPVTDLHKPLDLYTSKPFRSNRREPGGIRSGECWDSGGGCLYDRVHSAGCTRLHWMQVTSLY